MAHSTLGHITRLFEESHIDYKEYYIKAYMTYNAWYGVVTGTRSDRIALDALKKRFDLWGRYVRGVAMRDLQYIVECIAELTQREPLRRATSVRWDGQVRDRYDWRSLIEYWYCVRCMVVHGEDVGTEYVQLAYSSLTIFLREVIAGEGVPAGAEFTLY